MEFKKLSTKESKNDICSEENVEVEKSAFIKSGKGLIAKRCFYENEEIFVVLGKQVDYRTLRTLQTGLSTHIDPINKEGEPTLGYYLNHSCEPNAYSLVIEDKEEPILTIYALKQISKGDEITVDYSFMESEISNNCICKCGSKRCRGSIKGFNDLGSDEIENYISMNVPLSNHLITAYKIKKTPVHLV